MGLLGNVEIKVLADLERPKFILWSNSGSQNAKFYGFLYF